HPRDIQSLDDIERLPFTVKDDFRATYPYGLFAVPLKDVVRLHASSGTTGKVVVSGYTRADLAMWGEVMARTFAAGGVTA
ncbi:MAG TPA: phenylacetate--CoA ligase, partial [Ktedonobacter sp.]|nr:phenylacetate--CoA ligase [Ktedonobacter sp.]